MPRQARTPSRRTSSATKRPDGPFPRPQPPTPEERARRVLNSYPAHPATRVRMLRESILAILRRLGGNVGLAVYVQRSAVDRHTFYAYTEGLPALFGVRGVAGNAPEALARLLLQAHDLLAERVEADAAVLRASRVDLCMARECAVWELQCAHNRERVYEDGYPANPAHAREVVERARRAP